MRSGGWSRFRPDVPADNLIGGLGFVLLVAGLWLVAVHLALIVAGALLFGLAIWPWPAVLSLLARPGSGESK